MPEGFKLEPARQELLSGIGEEIPYKDLSDNARLLFNAVNLGLIKEHLADIKTLANLEKGPDLSHLGINYFETEIQDTLARGLSFIDKRLLSDNDLKIQVPIKQGDGKFALQDYKVDRFNLSGKSNANANPEELKKFHQEGHPIFLLKPEEGGPPLIVARGTLLADNATDGAFASIQADGRKDLSLKWIVGNPNLKSAMDELYKAHGPIQVCGHSLGGNIATTLAVAFPEHISRVTTISAPHVSKEVYAAWMNIPMDKRPKVDHIIVEHDLVPSGGKRIIGSAILAEQLDENNNPVIGSNPTDRHLQNFNNRNVRYAAINKTKETEKAIRGLNTANVIVAGRFVQEKTQRSVKKFFNFPVENAPMTRATALMELNDEIRRFERQALPQESKFSISNISTLVKANKPKAAIQILERAKPSEIRERYVPSLLDENTILDARGAILLDELETLLNNQAISLSPELARNLSIAFDLYKPSNDPRVEEIKDIIMSAINARADARKSIGDFLFLHELHKDAQTSFIEDHVDNTIVQILLGEATNIRGQFNDQKDRNEIIKLLNDPSTLISPAMARKIYEGFGLNSIGSPGNEVPPDSPENDTFVFNVDLKKALLNNIKRNPDEFPKNIKYMFQLEEFLNIPTTLQTEI